MTPHDHTQRVPGCYRCELGRDEAEGALVEEIAEELYAPLTVVSGFWRCQNCLRVIWMTGLPVEDCRTEGCGTQRVASQHLQASQEGDNG